MSTVHKILYENIVRDFLGIHCQAVSLHAEADWLRCTRRGHDNRATSQQQETIRKTHYGLGN